MNMKISILFGRWLVIASLIIVIGIPLIVFRPKKDKLLYIAFFGRIRNSPFAGIHRHALEHYLDLLSDDVPGYRFALKPYYLDDDEGRPMDDPNTLRWMYETIVAPDSRYVLVIDNTWAKHVQAAGPVIREQSIPMISLNADKGLTNFGGNAIFIGHSDLAPVDLVTYLNEVIHPATVGFVGEADYWLTNEFLALASQESATSMKPRLQLDHRLLVESSQTSNSEKKLLQEALNSWYRNAPQPATLLLNVHNDWGHEIIDYVDLNLHNVTILAASYAAREGKSPAFPRGDGTNKLILMTEPEDAVSKRIVQDAALLTDRFPDAFQERFNIPQYLRRCQNAAEIIREALLLQRRKHTERAGITTAVDRELFTTFFRNRLLGQSLPGRIDLYSFDSRGLLIPEVSFVEFNNGTATSCWSQLNSHREVIPAVFFGLELLDIGRLDPENGRFRADFYYWVRVQPGDGALERSTQSHSLEQQSSMASRPRVAGRPASDYIHFRNLSRKDNSTLIDGSKEGTYWLERISGVFNVDFDFKSYPFDRQELRLELELANPFDDVRVAFDHEAFQRGKKNKKIFDIPGWELEDYYVTVDNVLSGALRGALPGRKTETRKYKTLTVRIITKRKPQSALIAVGLPLFSIGLIALSLLFIRDIQFCRVGEIYVGILLSVITYSIAFVEIVPSSGIITKADLLLYLTFIIVVFVFLRFVLLNVLGRLDERSGYCASRLRILGFTALGAYLLLIFLIVAI